jgi:hypothetical protein
MMKRLCVLALSLLLVCHGLVAATDVGVGDGGRIAGLQQGNDANAERIFLVAVHKAEEPGLEDRRVAVSLSQLAQVYGG